MRCQLRCERLEARLMLAVDPVNMRDFQLIEYDEPLADNTPVDLQMEIGVPLTSLTDLETGYVNAKIGIQGTASGAAGIVLASYYELASGDDGTVSGEQAYAIAAVYVQVYGSFELTVDASTTAYMDYSYQAGNYSSLAADKVTSNGVFEVTGEGSPAVFYLVVSAAAREFEFDASSVNGVDAPYAEKYMADAEVWGLNVDVDGNVEARTHDSYSFGLPQDVTSGYNQANNSTKVVIDGGEFGVQVSAQKHRILAYFDDNNDFVRDRTLRAETSFEASPESSGYVEQALIIKDAPTGNEDAYLGSALYIPANTSGKESVLTGDLLGSTQRLDEVFAAMDEVALGLGM